MKEVKIGDYVQWKTLHTVKGKIVRIMPDPFTGDPLYVLDNNAKFRKHELKKVDEHKD